MGSNLLLRTFLRCLLIIHLVSKSQASAPYCLDVIQPRSIPGVGLNAVGRIKLALGFQRDQLSSEGIRLRYEQNFLEIFKDANPWLFRNIEINYANSEFNSLAHVEVHSEHIWITHFARNHPLYPLIHAHELQHSYDIQLGRIKKKFLNPNRRNPKPQVSQLDILRSEIRAYARQFQAAKILFSKEEIQELLARETDQKGHFFHLLKRQIQYENDLKKFIFQTLNRNYRKLVLRALDESHNPKESLDTFLLTEIFLTLREENKD